MEVGDGRADSGGGEGHGDGSYHRRDCDCKCGCSELQSELDCCLCLKPLCEPLTTACGHTFCRVCIGRCLEKRKACPLCRAPCHIDAKTHPENVVLSKVVSMLHPASYSSRLAEARSEMEEWNRRLPIFQLDDIVLFPNMKMNLHIFERKYRIMINRAMEGSRRFGFVVKGADVGTVAEIESVYFLPDGRSQVAVKGGERFSLLSHPEVEDGTFGLQYASIAYISDTDEVEQGTHPSLLADLLTAVDDCVEHRHRLVLTKYLGKIPLRPYPLSMWAAAAAPTAKEDKLDMLRSTSVIGRLEHCLRVFRSSAAAKREKEGRGEEGREGGRGGEGEGGEGGRGEAAEKMEEE